MTDKQMRHKTASRSVGRCKYTVYRVYNARDHLLYVGMTKNIRKRMFEHARKPWGPAIEWCSVEVITNRREAQKMEWLAIGSEHPIFNVHGNYDPEWCATSYLAAIHGTESAA